MFSILSRYCDIEPSTDCSTHVHVSPHNSRAFDPDESLKFDIDQLKRIIKGVIYYDAQLTMIMPADRKNSRWALSNVENTAGWETAYKNVGTTTWAPLFGALDRHTDKSQLLHVVAAERYLSWNFQNVPKACGTIEFRRPPAARTAAQAKHWIAVALGYLTHSMALQDWSVVKPTKTYPLVKDLSKAVSSGVRAVGQNSVGALGSMLHIRDPARPLTPQEVAEVERKKREKRNKESSFVEKVCFIINTWTSRLLS
jgi:hypothetical protein